MTNFNKTNVAIGVCGFSLLAGAVGVIFGLVSTIKANKIANKVGKAVDDIADSTEVKISEAVVEQAVNKAVDEEAKIQVDTAAKKACMSVEMDMRAQIKKEINATYSDIRGKVTDEVDRQVQSLNIRDIERDATDRAERRALKKFEETLDAISKKMESTYTGKLDSILNHYDSRMKDIDDIYSHISRKQKGEV